MFRQQLDIFTTCPMLVTTFLDMYSIEKRCAHQTRSTGVFMTASVTVTPNWKSKRAKVKYIMNYVP